MTNIFEIEVILDLVLDYLRNDELIIPLATKSTIESCRVLQRRIINRVFLLNEKLQFICQLNKCYICGISLSIILSRQSKDDIYVGISRKEFQNIKVFCLLNNPSMDELKEIDYKKYDGNLDYTSRVSKALLLVSWDFSHHLPLKFYVYDEFVAPIEITNPRDHMISCSYVCFSSGNVIKYHFNNALIDEINRIFSAPVKVHAVSYKFYWEERPHKYSFLSKRITCWNQDGPDPFVYQN
jgi:hypothetical protein